MAYIKTCTTNILDGATITCPLGGTPTGPKQTYRLNDRQFDRVFQNDVLNGQFSLQIVNGSAVQVDRLVIPAISYAGVGGAVQLQFSLNGGASWNLATQFMLAGQGAAVNVTFSPTTAAYWRLYAFLSNGYLQMAEMFLSPTVTWTGYPSHPYGPQEAIFNVDERETVDKRTRFIVNGASRRQRHYNLELMDDTFKAQVEALWTAWAGCRPFILMDHEGVMFPAKFTEAPEFETHSKGAHSAEVHLVEVL